MPRLMIQKMQALSCWIFLIVLDVTKSSEQIWSICNLHHCRSCWWCFYRDVDLVWGYDLLQYEVIVLFSLLISNEKYFYKLLGVERLSWPNILPIVLQRTFTIRIYVAFNIENHSSMVFCLKKTYLLFATNKLRLT